MPYLFMKRISWGNNFRNSSYADLKVISFVILSPMKFCSVSLQMRVVNQDCYAPVKVK